MKFLVKSDIVVPMCMFNCPDFMTKPKDPKDDEE